MVHLFDVHHKCVACHLTEGKGNYFFTRHSQSYPFKGISAQLIQNFLNLQPVILCHERFTLGKFQRIEKLFNLADICFGNWF